MNKLNYDPNQHFKLNTSLLVTGVVLGIIAGFIYRSALLLVLIPALSQYQWLIDLGKRVIFRDQIQSLDRLTNSASLADKRDNYTNGRYRDAVKYTLDMTNDDTHYLLYIDANGISNTRHLRDLAEEVGAAFHHPAYLQDVSNGVVVYWIDLKDYKKVNINGMDF